MLLFDYIKLQILLFRCINFFERIFQFNYIIIKTTQIKCFTNIGNPFRLFIAVFDIPWKSWLLAISGDGPIG